MFRGSPALSAGQLAEIAAGMGGEFDADTQQTVTQYFYTVPSEDLDLALHVEAIRMQGVLDTDQLWDKERGAIEQEVAQDLSNPEYVFYSRLLASVFKGTPYADDALGTRPSFDMTTGAMLKKFYDAWYAPPEQRDPGRGRRRSTATGTHPGQGAVRRHPGKEAPGKAGDTAATNEAGDV